jgi:hypothetical protein
MPYKDPEKAREHHKISQRLWAKNNPEKIKKYRDRWERNNPNYRKEYNKKNKDKQREKSLRWQKNNYEKAKESNKKWKRNNPEKVKNYMKKYRVENKKKIAKTHTEYTKYKYRTDIKYNISSKMSRLINIVLKGNKKGWHWETLVGYTSYDLIKHLQKTMPKNYTWEDYLSGDLHIDHIIPIYVFNYDKPEHIDFKKCWALKNLRLLPAKENLRKNKYISKPFQPALKI